MIGHPVRQVKNTRLTFYRGKVQLEVMYAYFEEGVTLTFKIDDDIYLIRPPLD